MAKGCEGVIEKVKSSGKPVVIIQRSEPAVSFEEVAKKIGYKLK